MLGGLEVACLLRKPKNVGSILAGVDRFSGSENCKQECHMIMWHVKDPLSIHLDMILTILTRREQQSSERFIQEVQPVTSIALFTRNIFDILFHPQWNCPMSPCSSYEIMYV
ncbi:hypothetical protein TNCV_4344051 [Trichonephila clavipes]|nr:hypothetical protein TNCV_4344051 [Trichonephila clavipes]